MSRATILRALADRVIRSAERLMPAAQAQWAAAMRSELEHIDRDRDALLWALGCWLSCLKMRIGEATMKHEATLGFSVAFVCGAAIWFLAPFVTGHAEPWDADGAFYLLALLVTGAIAGWLTPRKIAPILPGIALGQFLYMLLVLPIGPLWFVGLVSLFVYGIVALVAAFISSRLRSLWRRVDPTPRA